MVPVFYAAIFFSCFAFSAQAQAVPDWTAYMKRMEKADTLYRNGAFRESAMAYSNAFTYNEQNFSEGDHYNAARAWARAGRVDSAIGNLNVEIQAGFYGLQKLKKEPAFEPLKKMEGWKIILRKVGLNEKAENKKLGPFRNIKPELENILVLDQKYRQQYDATLSKFGPSSAEVKDLLTRMNEADKSNLDYVSNVLDKQGWPDNKIIGFTAGAALFLEVQHADSASGEKYLPLLQRAVREKKAFGSDLALLEDRVLIRRGQKQIYGSQIQCESTGKNCRVLPIEDENNVDKRRAEAGLQPLAEYVKHWNIIYKKPE